MTVEGGREEVNNDLTENIGQFLQAALEDGFELPVYLACVASNGSVIFYGYNVGAGEEPGLEAELLAEHIEDPCLILPINAVLTDSTGRAARMVIRPDEEPQVFLERSKRSH